MAALTALNAWMAGRVFGLDYHQPLSSIEPVFMAIARWMLDYGTSSAWVPLWYLGEPIQNAYPPLLPALTAATAAVAAIEPAAAYHWVAGAAYTAGPATLYLLARTLGLTAFGAGVAAAGYSILSPAALLFPSVWGDLGGTEGPRRLHALAFYGEGPHMLTLALWPAAVAALARAVERRSAGWVGLAALGAAAVALTNWLGSVALAAAAASLLAAMGWDERAPRRWLTAAGVGALAYLLAYPALPPSTIQAVRQNAPHSGGSFPMGAAQAGALLGLVAAAALLAWLLARVPRLPVGARFAALFSLLFGVPSAAMEFGGFHFYPQPHRFHLEMEQGLWLLGGAVAWGLAARFGRRLAIVAAAGLAVLAAAQAVRYPRALARWVEPVQPATMLQREAAEALRAWNPEARLFAAGSVEIWLNVFVDNPQTGGVFDQGVLWPYFPAYRYGMGYTVEDGARSARWLRVMGADAVFVSRADSREPYAVFWRDAAKFDGVLPELWRSGGDALYQVPRPCPGIAYALRPEEVVDRYPLNNEDEEAVAAFDDAIRDAARPCLTTRWEAPDRLTVEGPATAGSMVVVQEAWHAGWEATLNGEPVKTRADALGLLLAGPVEADGPLRLELRFRGPSWAPPLLAVAGWLAWFGVERRRRKPLSR